MERGSTEWYKMMINRFDLLFETRIIEDGVFHPSCIIDGHFWNPWTIEEGRTYCFNCGTQIRRQFSRH